MGYLGYNNRIFNATGYKLNMADYIAFYEAVCKLTLQRLNVKLNRNRNEMSRLG